MQQPQVHTQHQIVEEILPENMSEEVTKQVINQFLPQRKRKPRVPKTPKGNPPKIIKIEPQASGSDSITTITGISDQATNEGDDGESKEQLGEIIEQVEDSGAVSESGQVTTPDSKPKGEGKTPKDKSNSELKFFQFYYFALYFHIITYEFGSLKTASS